MDHVQKGKLKVHVYYGAGRDVKAEKLENVDVVITTYQVRETGYFTRIFSDRTTRSLHKTT